MNTVIKKHKFCYGHRIYKHKGKCQNPHGHNAEISFEFFCDELDELGMVIDFGVIKKTVCKWVDENFDHKFLVFKEDPLANVLKKFPGVVELNFNPTVENLCAYIFIELSDDRIKSITLSESSDNYAIFSS